MWNSATWRNALRISRVAVLLLFGGILWVALESGAFRYHLTASKQPVSLSDADLPQPDRLVEIEGVPELERSVRSGKGPFHFALVPLSGRRDVWLLFVGSVSREISPKMDVFRGRLVKLRSIPFVRHLAGRRADLSPRTLVVEVGHLPQRRWAWAFLIVFVVAAVGAQLLITLMFRVLRT